MKKEDKIKAVILAILGLAFLYVLFDWTMNAALHSRKEIMVPDLNGKSLGDAVSMLSSVNLGLKKEGEEFDENLPQGTVLRQNPLAGMSVREGKIVRVTISQGGKVIYVPNIVGQTVRSSEISIRSAGLSLGEISTKYSVVVQKDCVIYQDPQGGSTAEKDSLVNLVVSAGAPPANVKLMPDWSGRNIDDVKKWADENAFQLEIRREEYLGFAEGSVIRQEPAPDSEISSDTRLVFVVSSSNVSEGSVDKTFYYEIPQGGGDRQLRLTLIDDDGEKLVFKGLRPPGSKLELPINPKGRAKVRVFINDILVEEREVK